MKRFWHRRHPPPESPPLHEVYAELRAVEDGSVGAQAGEAAVGRAHRAQVHLSHELLLNELALETDAGYASPDSAKELKEHAATATQDLKRLRRLTEAARRRLSRP